MSEMRGIVTRVTFDVTYPDGSSKQSVYEPKERLNAVLLDERFMDSKAAGIFNVSASDWKKNPAMVIVDGNMFKPNCDYPDCQNA